jgi:tetratricopeptide (TPR) repeat protein
MMPLRSFHRTTLMAILLVVGGLLTMGAGCSSDPNVEGAKLDLRNKDYDRAIVNLDKALESDPNNYEAHYMKGQVFQEMSNEEADPTAHTELVRQMDESFSLALGSAPADEAVVREDISQRRRLAWYNEYQRGLAQYNRENYDDAVVFFTNATNLQPDSAATYVNLAFAYISGERTTEAVAPLESAIEKGDRNPDSYNYLSDLYLEADRPDDAVAILLDARAEFPDDSEVTARLFNVYARTGQLEEALPLAESEVERDPTNSAHRYNYGSLLLEAEKYDEAIVQLERSVELDPENLAALFNLGAAYQNKGVDLNEQVTALDEQIRGGELSDDAAAEAQTKMEEAAAERDRLFEGSIVPLSKARTLSVAAGEDVSGICTALGQAYARTNDMEKAQEAYACAEGN